MWQNTINCSRLLRLRDEVWCLMKRREEMDLHFVEKTRQLFTKAGVEAMPTYQMRYSKDNTVHWLDLVTPAVSSACWHYLQNLWEVGDLIINRIANNMEISKIISFDWLPQSVYSWNPNHKSTGGSVLFLIAHIDCNH